MRIFANLAYLSSVAPRFISLYRSRTFRRPELHDFLQQHIPETFKLPGVLQRRIKHYLFANAITSQWFTIIRGQKINDDEKLNCELMGLATPLFDALFDHLDYDLQQIEEMLSGISNDHLLVACRKLYQISLKRSKHPKLFIKYFNSTMNAQERSLQQKTNSISKNILNEITYQKGGFALLLYRTALHNAIIEEEKAVIFQLGGIMQLHNDIFDLHRDLSEGTVTLMTQCNDIPPFREHFRHEIQKIKKTILALPYEKSNLNQLNILFSIAVNSGFICLDQFENLQKKSGGIFQSEKYDRSELICDMEKPKNILRNILLTLRD